MAAKTLLITLLSQRLGRSLANALPLRTLCPPIPLPEFEVCQFWDETTDDDPGHRWFRELMAGAAQGSS